MDDKVKELQAELDNVAAVLRNYEAENLKIYKDAGVNAMPDICKVEIPYDLPYALQGALGMRETIEKNLNK